MNVTIRLTRELFELIKADLLRPHSYAAERVGFIFGKLGNQGSEEGRLILLSEYRPVEDGDYEDTWEAGARINSAAIRSAMQSVLDTGCGAFHVHLHPHR